MELEYITEEESPWRPELCRIWEQSVDLAAQPDPFCCAPVWQLSAHRAFAPGRRVLAQHTEDSVLVLAEAFLSSGQPLLTSLEAHWLFGCPLLGPDAIGLLAEALAVMSHGYGHLPALLLGGIVPGSRRARELYACCESLFTIYLAGECIQAGASLEGGLDGFLSRRSANLRSKWRKSFRRAADRGVTFERSCPTDTAGADAVYARMLAVEQRSWKGVGHCGMTESPAREFYADMIRRLAAQGTARVMFARHEGQTSVSFSAGCWGHVTAGSNSAMMPPGRIFPSATFCRWSRYAGCARKGLSATIWARPPGSPWPTSCTGRKRIRLRRRGFCSRVRRVRPRAWIFHGENTDGVFLPERRGKGDAASGIPLFVMVGPWSPSPTKRGASPEARTGLRCRA